MKFENLKINGLIDPIGIGTVTPEFSWTLKDAGQSSFLVEVWKDGQMDSEPLWRSGWHESNCRYITYDGSPLCYGMRLVWRVSIRTSEAREDPYISEFERFVVAPCSGSDWSGDFIGNPRPFNSERNEDEPEVLDREYIKEFKCIEKPDQAIAYVASYGYHEFSINGNKVDDRILVPSISYLPGRVLFHAYDVTEHLAKGENLISIKTGTGWSAFKHFHLKHGPAFNFQMDLYGDQDSVKRVVSDGTWFYRYTERRLLGFWEHSNYGGEFIDSGLNATESFPAEIVPVKDKTDISWDTVQPNKIMERIRPIETKRWAANSFLYDFGVNLAGSLVFKVKARPGCKLLIQYSDKANETQTFRQFDVYVCGSSETELFESRFNYHGFRWVLIHVFHGEADISEITACQVRNSYKETGKFECSDNLLNRINDFTLWTFKNLTLGGYIVDCPTRERWGYGDSFNGVKTALGFFDIENLYRKWLQDWRDVQDPKTGELPNTAPTIMGGGGPAWGSILIQLPWEIYQATGNRTVLEENYPACENFIRFLGSQSKDNILQRYGTYEWGFLGDWNAPRRGMWRGMRVEEEASNFFNSCYYFYNLAAASKIAKTLGKEEDSQKFSVLAQQVQIAVHKKFWDPLRKTYPNGEQTYRALPLVTGQAPDEVRNLLLSGLLDEIKRDSNHLNTGHLGTYFLLECLRLNRLGSVGEELLGKRTFPGFGYMLEKGATTVWEQWDGDNSEIHSCYLSAAGWMLETLGGLTVETDTAGTRTLRIEPQISGSLSSVSASRILPEGKAAIQYEIEGDAVEMKIELPGVDQVLFNPQFSMAGGFEATKSQMRPSAQCEKISEGEYRINFKAKAP